MKNIYALVAQAAMRLRCKLQVMKSESLATFSALYVQSLWQDGATPLVTQQPINHQTHLHLLTVKTQTVKTAEIISYKIYNSIRMFSSVGFATQQSVVKILLMGRE